MSRTPLPAFAALAVAIAILAVAPARAADAGDAANGEKQFKSRCVACHAMDKNKTGPQLAGVSGRKAGGVTEFKYSPALAASGIVWDDEKLDAWLAAPQKMVPGAKMVIAVPDAKTRADIIAYLKTQK
ncbi:MAG: cycA [Alphaproteobacteria bacterium]|jgi:cytochrome c|nr:cycA [Alphaproteobacteria bacterium]